MAKEMMIVFVYDTARCCKEEDDPADALIYFHPAWVSPTQRLALAGQLMGINQFLSTSFSTPSMISLQGGKFVLKKFGTYMLAVGTDRNIQDWILERRANILESLLKFFHCDFDTISASLNDDKNKFTEKLYQMFETYLPILQYSASLFSNIPMLKLPRNASSVFLESMQVLQYCQETNGIIGGALFYNNKVVASQLDAEITKQLVITDPYRVKAPADRITTNFHLPVGVQLFRVFVEQRQFSKLVQEANMERGYSSYVDTASKKSTHKKNLSKTKEQPVSMMKRDISRIFTVPEDAELDSTHYSMTQCIPPLHPTAYSSPVKRKEENNKSERPKYQHPLTPSVCSTPLKDVNRVLHDFAVSIVVAGDESDAKSTGNSTDSRSQDNKTSSESKEQSTDDIPDVVKEALRCKRLNKLKNATPKEKLIMQAKDRNVMSLSLTDLEDTLKKHSNKIVLKSYGMGLPKLNSNLCVDYNTESPREKHNRRQHYNTITDPSFPVFRNDGLPISQSLYDEYIASHYQELENNDSRSPKFASVVSSSLPPLPSNKLALKLEGGKVKTEQTEVKPNGGLDVRLDNKNKQETYRRSMSLPLKPLNALDSDDRRKSASECGGIFDLPQRRKLDGLQLTPLMSKLSLLADERTSGFCSRDTTPSEFRDLSGFSTVNNQLVKNKLEAVSKEGCSDNDDEIDEDWTTMGKGEGNYEKAELFLCGHQNMVLFLLMEDGTANDPELIHFLWETSVSILGSLEARLQQCLEPLPSNDSKELYSVLSVDSDWDTIHRSGLWGVTELDVVSSLHDRFQRNKNLTDIIVRTDDTVVYGNQCGNVEVFYQQAVAPNTTGGLPTPADLMGVVPLKAKRRLERDHAIVIL